MYLIHILLPPKANQGRSHGSEMTITFLWHLAILALLVVCWGTGTNRSGGTSWHFPGGECSLKVRIEAGASHLGWSGFAAGVGPSSRRLTQGALGHHDPAGT